ncbi:MAG: hypothetical protein PVG99_08940 [Desulfobacteraceae bacterium]|jgi:hypothetical protein
MDEAVIVNLDDDPIRFTPDGRMSVLDAIQALSNSSRPGSIWKTLKAEHPEILRHCDEYLFHGGDIVPVTGVEGWEAICALLSFYVSEEDLA